MNLYVRITQLIDRYGLHIRNVAYFLGTRAFAIIAFVLVVPFFIRNASEEQYGLAAIGFSLLTISTALDVAFGYVLVQSLGKRYARNLVPTTDSLNGLFSFYILLAIGIALCGLTGILALNLSRPETIMYGSLIALIPALSISSTVAAVFQAQNQLKPINLSRFSFELAKALALAVSAFAVNDISLIGPILLLASYTRAALDVKHLSRKTTINLRFQGTGAQVRRYWRKARYGIPSLCMVALMLPISIGDKLIIKQIFGAKSVAHFALAFDINAKAYLLVNAVNAAIFTIVLRRFTTKTSTFTPIAAGLATVTLLVILYYLPLFILTPYILTKWIGQEFASETTLLTRIMVFGSLFYLYGNIFENALNAMGKARQVLFVYLIATIAYGVSAFISFWHKTLNGFMVSYVVLYSILLIGFAIQYHRHSKTSTNHQQ